MRPDVPAGSMDIVIMIFVLSAIGPEKMRDVLVRAKEVRLLSFSQVDSPPCCSDTSRRRLVALS